MSDKKDQETELQVQLETKISQSEAFLVKNKKMLIIAVSTAVLVVAGYLLYLNFYLHPKELKAQTAIAIGQTYFDRGDFQTAYKGDSISWKGFPALATEYSGTKSANLAKAYAGFCAAQLGNYAEAVPYLTDYKMSDEILGSAVLGTLGDCYANLNQLDKATTSFLDAADKADNNSQSPLYLIKAAQIFEKQGAFDKAIKAYTQIKEKYTASAQYSDIDKYIERANLLKK